MSTKKKSKIKKKTHKYTKQKYPALNVKYQVANRRELIDYDYVHKLSEEDKDWLDRFTSEVIITNFNHRGEQLITDVEEKRSLYRDNNKRNVDIFSTNKANGSLMYSSNGLNKEDPITGNPDDFKNEYEDLLIAKMDVNRSLKKNKRKKSKKD